MKSEHSIHQRIHVHKKDVFGEISLDQHISWYVWCLPIHKELSYVCICDDLGMVIWLFDRVVKVMDLKSIGKLPRMFKPCSSRDIFSSDLQYELLLDIRVGCKSSIAWQCRQYAILKREINTSEPRLDEPGPDEQDERQLLTPRTAICHTYTNHTLKLTHQVSNRMGLSLHTWYFGPRMFPHHSHHSRLGMILTGVLSQRNSIQFATFVKITWIRS